MTDPSRSRTRKGYKRFSDSGIPVHRYVAETRLGRKMVNVPSATVTPRDPIYGPAVRIRV